MLKQLIPVQLDCTANSMLLMKDGWWTAKNFVPM